VYWIDDEGRGERSEGNDAERDGQGQLVKGWEDDVMQRGVHTKRKGGGRR
jgi:hypothetical protein